MNTKEIGKTNQAVLRYLRGIFGSKLVYVGYFGSVARGESNRWSDVDYLVAAPGLPADPIARDRLSRGAKQVLREGTALIALNFYTPTEIKNIAKERPWFAVGVIGGLVDLYDREGWMREVKLSAKRHAVNHDRLLKIIKNQPQHNNAEKEERKFLLKRSDEALRAASQLMEQRVIVKSEAAKAIYNSLSYLLRALLVTRGIYIVKGEIVQLFVDCYSDKLSPGQVGGLLSRGLAMEQVAGRYDGLSLDFSDGGKKLLDLDYYLATRVLKDNLKWYETIRKDLLRL
ncbi:MAG: nucleotidyltransferase domain-containing protein [Patescibacteria group bacterium]|jgi:hypothetical protein